MKRLMKLMVGLWLVGASLVTVAVGTHAGLVRTGKSPETRQLIERTYNTVAPVKTAQ